MTNGEKFLKDYYPNSTITRDSLTGRVFVNEDNADFTLPIEWWDAEYQEPTTKNGLGVEPQEPIWIPVSEKLPEKDMACLVAVGRFNFTQIAVYSDLMGIINHRIFYQGDVGHDSFKNITKYVKAWMPLPKPYREVEE